MIVSRSRRELLFDNLPLALQTYFLVLGMGPYSETSASPANHYLVYRAGISCLADTPKEYQWGIEYLQTAREFTSRSEPLL